MIGRDWGIPTGPLFFKIKKQSGRDQLSVAHTMEFLVAASAQIPSAIIMVRPHRFLPNPATADDNSFQSAALTEGQAFLARDAYAAVSNAAALLEEHGIKVYLFDDQGDQTPDSVYPNNWFSTHSDGRIYLYSMYAPNRRLERRSDIVELLKNEFEVSEVIDLSASENAGVFLEGTGSMVLDHLNRVAYAVRSKRTDRDAFFSWCERNMFAPLLFNAVDATGAPIYHTNVMMGIGERLALVGSENIPDPHERAEVLGRLAHLQSKGERRTVVELTPDQVSSFAGNVLELEGNDGRLLVLSSTALASLHSSQIDQIEQHAKLLPIDVAPIELGGGSIRCMMAGIHLPPKKPVGAAHKEMV